MKFGNFSDSWYRISLDTDQQIFYATSKQHPEQVASGVTIDEAVRKLALQAHQPVTLNNHADQTA
ncbi:hypothetical protein MK904_03485 [Loigolactobacillus coryniformis]|jgi:hypothetical protein|uniref:Uncharacterized protein n=3 Tax=Loigolactobacillus coryniformis TaxID=1610 RepID=A0A0R1EYB6_9LACO|nr:hypothetical protein [Loigolactobacillus coryniformis]MDT3391238.1 hypothetical protein [Bacillota bacterium]OEH89318.1 hypothetical protein ATO00_12035 [Loigolactobacillus coryniformis subsp. coryniformis]RRG05027.1 MAG: hypothetical protein DUD28_07605 [Lactobacillus sp.]ATO44304.1 hypothetical protein LC20004_10565 [Loigolactobacillus coryniformis subsp. torquens DSM 20004 = KCTC 3535]ATO55992.1 hypothetical protein LC20001_10370 [Loigolactobacillus coryniformis subsp. coryniformis KCTC 